MTIRVRRPILGTIILAIWISSLLFAACMVEIGLAFACDYLIIHDQDQLPLLGIGCVIMGIIAALVIQFT